MNRQKKKVKRELKPKIVIVCSNCGERGPHFVPPSCGDPGYYICTHKKSQKKELKIEK